MHLLFGCVPYVTDQVWGTGCSFTDVTCITVMSKRACPMDRRELVWDVGHMHPRLTVNLLSN